MRQKETQKMTEGNRSREEKKNTDRNKTADV